MFGERRAGGRTNNVLMSGGRGERASGATSLSSIWEIHAAQKILESRVGTQRVDPGRNFVYDDIFGMLVERLVQERKRFVFFSQVEVQNAKCVRRNMLASRTLLQLLKNISGPTFVAHPRVNTSDLCKQQRIVF